MTNESHSDASNNKTEKTKQETADYKNLIQSTDQNPTKKTQTNPVVVLLAVIALASGH